MSIFEDLTAWDLFLEFLEKLGVDRNRAVQASVAVEAEPWRGSVTVTEFARDEDGRMMPPENGEFVKSSTTYEFHRTS